MGWDNRARRAYLVGVSKSGGCHSTNKREKKGIPFALGVACECLPRRDSRHPIRFSHLAPSCKINMGRGGIRRGIAGVYNIVEYPRRFQSEQSIPNIIYYSYIVVHIIYIGYFAGVFD